MRATPCCCRSAAHRRILEDAHVHPLHDNAVDAIFINREGELAALRDAFADAKGGRSRLVMIEGEGRIGKTTLIERFLAQLDQARVVRASGDATETELPFALADQLLRNAGEVLREPQHLAAGLQVLEAISAEVTTVVFVDDAHLADPQSLRALLFAARRLARCQVLLLLALRGTVAETLTEGWAKLGDRLTVAPLQTEDVRSLAGALGVGVTADAASRLRDHTNGNPLHVRAVLGELPEGWEHEPRPLPVPRSYTQIVRARLDRCDPDVIALIEAAAVLGVRAPLHLVAELAELAAPLETLDAAVATELVRAGDRDLEFTHPLARAAVYEALPIARRAALNAHAARLVPEAHAALRHRVEAATLPDAPLVADLERHAREERARGS